MNRAYILGTLALSLTLFGCQVKETLDAPGVGDEVVFGSSMLLDPATKTEYEAPTSGNIRWSGGETLQIQALPTGASAVSLTGNYSVNTEHVNRSSVDYASGDRLRWRTDGYTFYGFYPASIGENFAYANGAETLSGLSVAASQSQEGIMERLYMFARKQQNRSQGQSVELVFNPLVTTVGITVTNRKSTALTLSGIQLTATDQDLSGSYSVSFNGSAPLADNAAGWPTSVSGGSRTVSLSGNLVIAPGASETCYLLIAPQVYDAGKVTLSLACGDKSYSKNLGTVFQVSQLLPAHKYQLAVNISDEGNISITDISLGGAQLLLCTLRNNTIKVKQLLKAYFGFDGPEWMWGSQANFDKYQSIMGKISTNADEFLKAHWLEADKVFIGGETFSFTADELDILKTVVLENITNTGTIGQEEYTKITADIRAADFAWLPNLEEIEKIASQSGEVSIVVDNLSQLENVTLQYFGNITISNCDALVNSNAIQFQNITNAGVFRVENCQNLTACDLGDMGNANARSVYFVGNESLTSVKLTDAALMHIEGSPDFTTLEMSTANDLARLELINTPKFTSASLSNTPGTFTALLQNCSTEVTEGRINLNTSGRSVSRDDANSYNCSNVTAYVAGTRIW